MTQTTDFDRLLASWMEADGPQDISQRVVAAAFRETRDTEQRRDITGAVLRLLPRSTPAATAQPQTRRGPRLSMVLLVALLVALLAGAALLVGSQLLKPSPALLIAPDRGVFAPTGPMAVGRSAGATATLLRDGRVLVPAMQAPCSTLPSHAA